MFVFYAETSVFYANFVEILDMGWKKWKIKIFHSNFGQVCPGTMKQTQVIILTPGPVKSSKVQFNSCPKSRTAGTSAKYIQVQVVQWNFEQ